MKALVLLALAALAGTIFALSRQRGALVLARRAALFDPLLPRFSDRILRTDPMGFPRLGGKAGGAVWDLQLVPDLLAVRKLPALWLLVSIPEPMPLPGTLHLLLRPTGAEGFTRFRDLPDHLPLPPGFPPDAALRAEGAFPDPDLLRPFLSLGTRLKEVIVAPRGLRVTLLADEADRTPYLILRESDLGQAPPDPVMLDRAMGLLLDLRAALLDNERKSP